MKEYNNKEGMPKKTKCRKRTTKITTIRIANRDTHRKSHINSFPGPAELDRILQDQIHEGIVSSESSFHPPAAYDFGYHSLVQVTEEVRTGKVRNK